MKLLITARMENDDIEKLKVIFSEVTVAGWGKDKVKLTEDEMTEQLSQMDAAIIEFEPVTEKVLSGAKNLKLLACCRNEPEANVDIEAATSRGIPVLSGAGRNAVSVVEFNFGMMLSLSRNISKTDYLLKHTDEITGSTYSKNTQLKGPSEWSLDASAPFNRYGGPELYGKNLGIVGLGTIGRVAANMGRAFGMNLIVYDPYVSEEQIFEQFGGRKFSLEQLMQESDFISLHAKVTEETKGLINYGLLSLMKPTAYIVNTARAAIMDYDALYEILKERKIAGAALDVYPDEPLTKDNPFLQLDNVLLTPHLAGSSHDIPKHHSKMVTEDVLRFFQQQRPVRLMNPQALEKRP
jgi:D-3-phosphoglycerate dehydrogenase